MLWTLYSYIDSHIHSSYSYHIHIYIIYMIVIVRTCSAPMFGFGNWWQSLWTNGCLELYLKDLSIGFSWSPCVVSRSLWVDQCAIRELCKDWSCECWAYCKHVLKKKIVWSFMFTFKTSSKWRELERFKVDQD